LCGSPRYNGKCSRSRKIVLPRESSSHIVPRSRCTELIAGASSSLAHQTAKKTARRAGSAYRSYTAVYCCTNSHCFLRSLLNPSLRKEHEGWVSDYQARYNSPKGGIIEPTPTGVPSTRGFRVLGRVRGGYSREKNRAP
jgi:hypothetical protein